MAELVILDDCGTELLRYVVPDGSDGLVGAILQGAHLQGAQLAGANLKGVQLTDEQPRDALSLDASGFATPAGGTRAAKWAVRCGAEAVARC
jgi:uncharacterized protein YjbI with pentapeptide repeats